MSQFFAMIRYETPVTSRYGETDNIRFDSYAEKSVYKEVRSTALTVCSDRGNYPDARSLDPVLGLIFPGNAREQILEQ